MTKQRGNIRTAETYRTAGISVTVGPIKEWFNMTGSPVTILGSAGEVLFEIPPARAVARIAEDDLKFRIVYQDVPIPAISRAQVDAPSTWYGPFGTRKEAEDRWVSPILHDYAGRIRSTDVIAQNGGPAEQWWKVYPDLPDLRVNIGILVPADVMDRLPYTAAYSDVFTPIDPIYQGKRLVGYSRLRAAYFRLERIGGVKIMGAEVDDEYKYR